MSHSSALVFYEQQTADPWVWALLMAVAFIVVGSLLWSRTATAGKPKSRGMLGVSAAVAAIVILLTMNLLCMRTVVDKRAANITFGWLIPMYRQAVPLSQIATAKVVTYSPLGEYGGWGIRSGADGDALNMRGDRGVQLVLKRGDHLLIGSQRPELLLAALKQ